MRWKPSDIIRTYGWVQGRPGCEVFGFCLVGAMMKTLQPDALMDGIGAVSTAIYGENVGGLISWNDAPGRTKEDVLCVLESVGL